MSLIRVQTRWVNVAGSPYYTNLYAVGPLSTNNGNDLADAWRAFLDTTKASYAIGLVAQIQSELLEFDEGTGTVTGAGTTVQADVAATGTGDMLPLANQGLIRWSTDGIVHNRRVRGRTFLPAMLETLNTSTGGPSGTLIANIDAAITTLLATMAGRMRIWAQPFAGTAGPPVNPARAGSAHEVTDGGMAGYWAVLRSRRD
jgi:hypothetical protein